MGISSRLLFTCELVDIKHFHMYSLYFFIPLFTFHPVVQTHPLAFIQISLKPTELYSLHIVPTQIKVNGIPKKK